jgi:hypothetical protein
VGTAKTDRTPPVENRISAEVCQGVADKTAKTASVAEKSAKESMGGTAKTDKTTGMLAEVIPCAVCGRVVRWNDQGVLRCVTCWPTPLTRKARAAERAYERTSR